MKDSIVVGQHFATEHPECVAALSEKFDTHIPDVLHLGDSVEALAGRRVIACVTRIEYLEIFTILTSMLAARGTFVEHFITWGPEASGWSRDSLNKLGFCGSLDTDLTAGALVNRVSTISESCENHAHSIETRHVDVLGTAEGNGDLSELDTTIAHLVSLGLCDRRISEIVNFSNQTVRNRMSRMMRGQGFENRTELAMAQMRHAMSTYASKSAYGRGTGR